LCWYLDRVGCLCGEVDMQCVAGNAGAKSSMSISKAQQSHMIETHMIVSS